jgi:hypothetical protein
MGSGPGKINEIWEIQEENETFRSNTLLRLVLNGRNSVIEILH